MRAKRPFHSATDLLDDARGLGVNFRRLALRPVFGFRNALGQLRSPGL
jgi:hypothetical protein